MDKSKEYGFSLPKGTWMISMKVNNDDIWQKVKAGEIKGFSIEGYFADKVQMTSNNKKIIEQLKELLNGN
jgi:phage head maturation protease